MGHGRISVGALENVIAAVARNGVPPTDIDAFLAALHKDPGGEVLYDDFVDWLYGAVPDVVTAHAAAGEACASQVKSHDGPSEREAEQPSVTQFATKEADSEAACIASDGIGPAVVPSAPSVGDASDSSDEQLQRLENNALSSMEAHLFGPASDWASAAPAPVTQVDPAKLAQCRVSKSPRGSDSTWAATATSIHTERVEGLDAETGIRTPLSFAEKELESPAVAPSRFRRQVAKQHLSSIESFTSSAGAKDFWEDSSERAGADADSNGQAEPEEAQHADYVSRQTSLQTNLSQGSSNPRYGRLGSDELRALDDASNILGTVSTQRPEVSDRQTQLTLPGILSRRTTLHSMQDSMSQRASRVGEEIAVNGNGRDLDETSEQQERLSKSITPWANVQREDFTVLATLGSGGFGEVRLVEYFGDGRQYAMKTISKELLRCMDRVDNALSAASPLLERDVGVAARLWRSPFIVELYATFQTPDKLHYIYELCHGGELFHLLKASGRFEERAARFYVAEIVLALDYLHGHDIIHRDVKMENVMLARDGHIKLADFGSVMMGAPTPSPCDSSQTALACVFMPPEFWGGALYGKELDCWQLGVAAYAMFTGCYPRQGGNVCRDDTLEVSEAAWDLCESLLEKDREERLGYPDGAVLVRKHSFFLRFDWISARAKRLVPPFAIKEAALNGCTEWAPNSPQNSVDMGRVRLFTWAMGPNADEGAGSECAS